MGCCSLNLSLAHWLAPWTTSNLSSISGQRVLRRVMVEHHILMTLAFEVVIDSILMIVVLRAAMLVLESVCHPRPHCIVVTSTCIARHSSCHSPDCHRSWRKLRAAVNLTRCHLIYHCCWWCSGANIVWVKQVFVGVGPCRALRSLELLIRLVRIDWLLLGVH